MSQRTNYEAWYSRVFREQYLGLLTYYEIAKEKYPDSFKTKPKVILLKQVTKGMPIVCQDPSLKIYRLGKTLGKKYSNFRRVKEGLPQRYRLFFLFSSQEHKVVFVWLNDETTLRKADAKTDVYAVFKKHLDNGYVSCNVQGLLSSASKQG